MAAAQIRLLGLCAGVGMLDEGLAAGIQHAGGRARTVGYVERDSYAAACLLARMEEQSLEPAPVWAGNLEAVRWRDWHGAVDCVVAGFPCQPWSAAGKREGEDDDRWLWPDITGCLSAVEPLLCFFENVRGLVSGGGLELVLADLARLGFDAQWGVLSASAVGAAHERERVFILAYRGRDGREFLRQALDIDGRDARRNVADGCDQQLAHTIRSGGERRRDTGVLGEAPAVEHREGLQRERAGHTTDDRRGDVADTGRAGREGRLLGRGDGAEGREGAGRPAAERGIPLFAPGPADGRWREFIEHNPGIAPAIEPGLRVLADGVEFVVDESRADQLRCGGNGVVPLQAAVAFELLAGRALS